MSSRTSIKVPICALIHVAGHMLLLEKKVYQHGQWNVLDILTYNLDISDNFF